MGGKPLNRTLRVMDTMKKFLSRVFLLCGLAGCHTEGLSQNPFKPGYYTTRDNGVPFQVSFCGNGELQVVAGGETSVWQSEGSGKFKRAYYYYNDPNKITTAKVRTYVERISESSFYFYIYEDAKKRYVWQSGSGAGEAPYNTDNLDEQPMDPRSDHVDHTLKRVEEVAPGWEKYMTKAKEDPGNAQVWMQAAHAAMLVSSYRKDPEMLNQMLSTKASLIKKLSPGSENPCPDLIPQEIWNQAK